MKRSQSSPAHRHISKKRSKSSSRQKIKKSHLNTERNQKVQRSPIKENQTQTPTKGIELRVANIRKGFADLQKKLNFSTQKKEGNYGGIVSPTQKKKKQHVVQFVQQKLSKSKKRKGLKTENRKLSPNRRYHECIYQKSFHHLIKIISSQKEEIDRLAKKKIGKKRK